jgi:hypothetical protein
VNSSNFFVWETKCIGIDKIPSIINGKLLWLSVEPNLQILKKVSITKRPYHLVFNRASNEL